MTRRNHRIRARMKFVAWVIGAFAVLVTFIADDVDFDANGREPAAASADR